MYLAKSSLKALFLTFLYSSILVLCFILQNPVSISYFYSSCQNILGLLKEALSIRKYIACVAKGALYVLMITFLKEEETTEKNLCLIDTFSALSLDILNVALHFASIF